MRITNPTIFNTSVNNMFRNARHVNDIIVSIETGKRIQRPSDDPILSNRALRFRNFLAENNQFMTNADTAMSWMEVSEASFHNILTGRDSIMARINEQLVFGATGSNDTPDVAAIIAELRELFAQLTTVEMNQTYMGRYVFSGFHTDQPPVLTSNMTGRTFVMEQNFSFRDIEQTVAFHRPNPFEPHILPDVNLLKLPFNNVNLTSPHGVDGVPPLGIFGPDGTPLAVNIVTIPSSTFFPSDPPVVGEPDYPAYMPPETTPPTIHFIADTGELVIPDNALSFFEDGVVVRFSNATFGVDDDDNVYTSSVNDFRAGELNPMINFRSWELNPNWVSVNPPPPNPPDNVAFRAFNSVTQDLRVEVSSNSHITLNSHARNIVTPQLYADFKRLFEFIDTLQPTNPWAIRTHLEQTTDLTGDALQNYVDEFLSEESRAFATMIYSRFNSMLKLHEGHITQAQREHTNLGTRMTRLDMIHVRLEENEIQYTALLSENEDTDIPTAIMRRNSAESAFRDALRAIAMVSQLSLADFIGR